MGRGKLEQIIDVFEACRNDASTAGLMKTCHLNRFAFRTLLHLLQEEGYLNCYPTKSEITIDTPSDQSYKRAHYRLTEKGKILLELSTPMIELKRKLYPSRRPLNVVTVK